MPPKLKNKNKTKKYLHVVLPMPTSPAVCLVAVDWRADNRENEPATSRCCWHAVATKRLSTCWWDITPKHKWCSFHCMSGETTKDGLGIKSAKCPGAMWGTRSGCWSHSRLQAGEHQGSVMKSLLMAPPWVAPDLSTDGHFTAPWGNLS